LVSVVVRRMVAVRGMARVPRGKFVDALLRVAARVWRRWRKTPAADGSRYKNRRGTDLKAGRYKCFELGLRAGWPPAFLDFAEESVHFGRSADGDTHEAGAHIF
jgi:hypothetical protein